MLNKVSLVFIAVSLIFSFSVQAQKYTISGYISDEATGEKLIGASIYEPNLKTGTTTNLYGFFSFTVQSADSVTILIRYIGYKSQAITMQSSKDVQLNFKLSPSIELKTFEIVEVREVKIEEKSQMSVIEIPISQIKSIPAFLGEVDVLKSLQLLPGVQSGGEGASGLYVRGGGPDQNLILLDGAPVYNASHLFGFFSVFNADAIKNVQLTKGGFPARYGGRLSSVIEINLKEGNTQKFSGEGSVGIIASRLTLEGPIIKDKTSFIISARRTYIDILARPIINQASDGNGTGGYYFYDLNAKINHKISEKDHVFLSFYSGDDRFYAKNKGEYTYDGNKNIYSDEFKIGWGNSTSTLRWNHIITPKLFSNTSLIYSRFNFYTEILSKSTEITPNKTYTNDFALKFLTGIEDISGKIDFDYIPSTNHYIKFGVGNINHAFNTGAIQYKSASTGSTGVDTTLGTSKIYANELSAYIEDDYRISARLKANFGMHYSGFSVKNNYYQSFQPRFSGRYFITENLAFKASYAKMMQFIHLLANAGIGLPTDLWVPSTDKIKPQVSDQVAAGFARTLRHKDNDYEVSIEGYYKIMENIIDYKGGANFFNQSQNWESQVEAGKGWSYGTEFFVQKKTGRTTGWIGYTLSWTERQFPEINFGEKFPYKYDRRHDISFVLNYKITDNIDVSGTWVYGTGNAITLPIARYIAMPEYSSYYYSSEIEHYESRNGFRMRAYHRMDLGVNFRKVKKWGERTINVSVYNAYNRKNPYFYAFSNDEGGNRVIKQYSLFPILPSISYNFKF
ncbi:MAG: TonB-dependent receptor [Bacteroidetes bacterium]|nr:TonB-dependent receptor [Bacteroidota bacterium]HET6243546.1 TonB-dependent receptor [Bacteroidia bacterium]